MRKPALLPVLLFLLLGITLGTGLVAFWPSPSAPLGLEAVEVNDAIVLRWNRQSPTVQHASGGILEITDGNEKLSQPLAVRDIQLGLATYHRRTDHAEFKLTVEQPKEKAVAESVVVTGPVPGGPAR